MNASHKDRTAEPHLCLSRNPACSGINPCEPCMQATNGIMARCLALAGYTDADQMAFFFQALLQERSDFAIGVMEQTRPPPMIPVQPTINAAEPAPTPLTSKHPADDSDVDPADVDREPDRDPMGPLDNEYLQKMLAEGQRNSGFPAALSDAPEAVTETSSEAPPALEENGKVEGPQPLPEAAPNSGT